MELELNNMVILSFINAIDGKRGKGSIVTFLTGSRSKKSLRLLEETGLLAYYGIFSRSFKVEIEQHLTQLVETGYLMVKSERLGAFTYPLLFLTEEGKIELAKVLSDRFAVLEELLKANRLIKSLMTFATAHSGQELQLAN